MIFNNNKAIYLQIADYIFEQVLQDNWIETQRIPSVRDLGIELEVNPNTVMRTYDFLQNQEIIYNERGIGYFLSPHSKKKIISLQTHEFFNEILPDVFKRMKMLNIDIQEIEKKLNQYS